jgi:hypothetical protein
MMAVEHDILMNRLQSLVTSFYDVETSNWTNITAYLDGDLNSTKVRKELKDIIENIRPLTESMISIRKFIKNNFPETKNDTGEQDEQR